MDNDKETKKTDDSFVLPYNIGDIFRKLLIAWIYAAIIMYLQIPRTSSMLDELEGYNYIHGGTAFVFGLMLFIILLVYPIFIGERRILERGGVFVGFVGLATASLLKSFSATFLGAILVAAFLLLIYADFGWNDGETSIEDKKLTQQKLAPKVAVITGLGFFLLVASWTVCRVKTHSTPTYDFGIFAQMFYSMKTHGTMVTTLERQETMSHLFVHVSFIYYLMLPFYFLYSRPEMLEILQAAVLASAFYPLWKICRSNGIRSWETAGIVALLALYPAYAGGCSYDLHENVFLTPLILWLFYFLEKKWKPGIIITSILILSVKEDAAVYVAVIALWLLLRAVISKVNRRWLLIAGGSMFVASMVYFVGVTAFLQNVGDGVMTGRYKNFMYNDSDSLITVIKAIIMQPMKALYECTEPEKLPYIGMTIGALGLVPLMTRKYERFVLLIPYLLINLLSDYGYQHDIFFQYGYGPTAFLFYLFIINYVDIRMVLSGKFRKYRKYFIVIPLAICAVLFYMNIIPKAMKYMERYREHYQTYVGREWIMDQIPEDKSVAATTYFTVYMSSRDNIYDIKHARAENVFSCDYLFVDYGEKACFEHFANENNPNGYDAFMELVYENDYEKSDLSGFGIDLFIKKENYGKKQ